MARPLGLMAPVNVTWPAPLVNALCIVVLSESLLLTDASLPRSAGVARNIGATRSFESALASSIRGSTTSVGPGSTSAMKPRKFRRHSVLNLAKCSEDAGKLEDAARYFSEYL